jgi:DNA-binding response OmpR family regulator
MSLKLLLVDDDPDVLRVLKEMLKSLSYEVLALDDAEAAAERIGREKFDGIFLDAIMPRLSGFELSRRIRASASNSSAPIIMLTGYDDVDTMRAGFKAGITFFLGKPPDLKRLGGLLRCLHDAMLREKRSYVRLPLRTVVTCEFGEHRFTSTSLNISEGGILLDCSGGLTVGNGVSLRLSVPGWPEMLNPRGMVVRKEPPDSVGVQFTELSSDERKAIRDYIAGRVKE